MISQSTIERVNEIPIYDVVSQYVDLKRSGSSWKAKSPFTDEKSASFYVVPRKNFFKDFSSGKGGSAITFVMLKFGKSYPEAIKEIAERFHVAVEYEKLSEEDKKVLQEKDFLYKVNEATALKYHEQLLGTDHNHPAYQELIFKRRYTDETILQWQLGYAPGDTDGFQPNQWRFIVDLVGATSRQAAMDLGLIKEEKGHTYDSFRHRLIYPIHDHLGRIVAFGGRALSTEQEKFGKYINSKESSVFKKEQILFGLYFAQKAIQDAGYAYLMEGYTDVISFHQADFSMAVGTCGTALSESQCRLLKRFTDKAVLFRDGDEAGEKATMRDIDILVQHGFQVAVVPMPAVEGKKKVDPDDLTRMF